VAVNLLFEGVIRYDAAGALWYAIIDQATLRHTPGCQV
jgi:hypothetical protein